MACGCKISSDISQAKLKPNKQKLVPQMLLPSESVRKNSWKMNNDGTVRLPSGYLGPRVLFGRQATRKASCCISRKQLLTASCKRNLAASENRTVKTENRRDSSGTKIKTPVRTKRRRRRRRREKKVAQFARVKVLVALLFRTLKHAIIVICRMESSDPSASRQKIVTYALANHFCKCLLSANLFAFEKYSVQRAKRNLTRGPAEPRERARRSTGSSRDIPAAKRTSEGADIECSASGRHHRPVHQTKE